MRQEAKRLEIDRMQVELMRGCQGYLRRFQYTKKMRILETCTVLAEIEFDKLKDQADYNKRVDPLKYIGKLLLSIITFVVGSFILLLLVLQLADYNAPNENSSFLNPIDELGKYLDENVDTDGNDSTSILILELFICILFSVTNLFIIWITYHGNHTLGQRHAFFTFYHMKESETLLNSFIVNTTIKSLVSMGALQYTTSIFFYWARGSMVLLIALYNKNSIMNIKIRGNTLFNYLLVASVVAACVYLGFQGSGRIRYSDAFQSKAQRKSAKASGNQVTTD